MGRKMSDTTWPEDLAELHQKFRVNEAVELMDAASLREFLLFRLSFLKEELRESETAETAAEFVDGMIDLCVAAVGTLDAFGVDAQLAWDRVHSANMAKRAGVNLSRPNRFGLPDLVKPPGWVAPDHSDNVGLLHSLFGQPTLIQGEVRNV